jgi:galactoside O-acetyltransferase
MFSFICRKRYIGPLQKSKIVIKLWNILIYSTPKKEYHDNRMEYKIEGSPEEQLRGKELMTDYNLTRPSETEKRISLVQRMFKRIGGHFRIEPPVYFAYGSHISIGRGFYANFNLTIIDDWEVAIGNRVLLGSNVTIYASDYPLNTKKRRNGRVIIEDDVWIESGAVINAGVTIRKGSVIGAGSVVTGDIPPNSIAVGNPCKVLGPVRTDREILPVMPDIC